MRAYPATLYCSAYEYDTSSTTNDEGTTAKNRRDAAGAVPPATLKNREYGRREAVPSPRWPPLRCGGLRCISLGRCLILLHKTSAAPCIMARCDHRSWAKNGLKVLLLRSMVSVLGHLEAGGSESVLLTKSAIAPNSKGMLSG